MTQQLPNSGGNKWVEQGQRLLLSPTFKKRSERIVLTLAIVSYLCHLLLIALSKQGLLKADIALFSSPISAIYTPFSFILVYEVYLLLFYLPKSTTFYIGKQYEIITLIVIRRIFKDLGELKLVSNWFENANDLQFTYDVVTSLLLFFLIYLFYHKIIKRPLESVEESGSQWVPTAQFIFLKKVLALVLVPVLVGLAIYSFSSWVAVVVDNQLSGIAALSNINTIFFDEFFTILIIVDVLLLLASFYYSDHFHTIIRNSGFVLSTILIKLSFSVLGILNNALIVGSVVFGLFILHIHQLYERAHAMPR
jgi:hypothetical protein